MIGCDHNYHENTKPSQSVVTPHGDKTNHFHKNYREKGEKVLSANIELMNESFNTAKSFFVDKKIEIYNSTRGGKLDIFIRKDFKSLFKTSD